MADERLAFDRRQLLKWMGVTGTVGLAGCTESNTGGGAEDDGDGDENQTGSGDGGDGDGGDGGDGDGSDQLLLSTAGGSPGGVGYAIMNALLSAASAEYPELSYNILPGGWTGNNTRLQNQEIDVGHSTLAAGTLAYNLTEPYDEFEGEWEQPPENIRSVLADQSEIFFFVVTQPDFPYETLTEAAEDEYAINVTNQPEGTFGGFLWDTVLAELDYGQQRIEELDGSYRRVNWDDAAQLFSDEQVDAILAVGGRDLGWLNSIAANRDVKYLNWEEEFRDQISEDYGVLKAELEDVFPKQSGELRCTQDSGLVNTQVDANTEAIYKMTHGIIQRQDQIRESTGLLEPFEASEAMVEPVPFDLHEGAVQAYEEAGIEIPDGG